LSPALAAELDRVVAETRQTLEQEFQKRLQTAVREAETATKASADAQMARAVAETKEATKKQVSTELEESFRNKLAETKEATKKQVSAELEESFRSKLAEATAQLKGEASVERARLQEQIDQWRVFAETQRQLAEASSQPEILARFLKIAQPFAAGLGLYVAKSDGLALWKHRGNGAFPEIISQQITDPEAYFRPIVVRAKIVAAVCAMPPFSSGALDFLSSSLERAIEVFGLKLKAPVPKPVIASETTTAAGQPSGAKPESPAAEVTAAGPQPDDQKAHADARRIARLLVSEIKLYHEPELKEGRVHSDIYDRLQKEIDLGREAYTHRVPGFVIAAHDYFHEEVVRILGENDLSRLGSAYPGPVTS
jgi:hypothetical protein